MDHLTLRLADLTILAYTVQNMDSNGDTLPSEEWQVEFSDTFSGKRDSRRMTNEQFNAIVILALAGDEEIIRASQEGLYAVAGPVADAICDECRPIP